MTERVYQKDIHTLSQLKARVKKVWKELEPELLMSLVHDVKTRIRMVPVINYCLPIITDVLLMILFLNRGLLTLEVKRSIVKGLTPILSFGYIIKLCLYDKFVMLRNASMVPPLVSRFRF